MHAAAEHGAHRIEGAIEARALAVEAVEGDQARELELLGRRPGLLGRDLHAAHGVDDHERRFRDA